MGLQHRVHRFEQLPQRMDALAAQIVQLREEMRSGFSATLARDGELSRTMHELFESNERHMRLLHEDLVQRIATIKGG